MYSLSTVNSLIQKINCFETFKNRFPNDRYTLSTVNSQIIRKIRPGETITKTSVSQWQKHSLSTVNSQECGQSCCDKAFTEVEAFATYLNWLIPHGFSRVVCWFTNANRFRIIYCPYNDSVTMCIGCDIQCVCQVSKPHRTHKTPQNRIETA